jgi:hypothetical protein
MSTSPTRRGDPARWLPPDRWFPVRALVVTVLLWPGSISAHEPGIGQAVFAFPSPNECVVDLTVDAASLLARLELLAGRPRSGVLTGPESVAGIAALQQEFIRHVSIRVDGVDTAAVLESVRQAADSSQSAGYPVAPEVRLRMHGTIPSGARSATWRYDLTFASYALIVKAAGGAGDSTEWLEGGQESRAFSLKGVGEPPSRMRGVAMYGARAYTHMRANGFEYLVAVLGMVPFSRRLRSIMWRSTGPEHCACQPGLGRS